MALLRELPSLLYNSSPWSRLPSPALEIIYSFLNRRDQHSFSLVCRSWREEFSSPRLWRGLTFRLPHQKNDADSCQYVNFARRYGAMFHHLQIVFGSGIRSCQLDGTLRHLKMFLQAVTHHSQLLSISFVNAAHYFRLIEDPVSEEVYGAVLSFLKSQYKLRSVEFENAQFSRAEAIEILKVIFANNSETVRHIRLSRFAHEWSDGELVLNSTMGNDLNIMNLRNLQKWKTDYSQIFENMMMSSFNEYRNDASVDLRGQVGDLQEMELICNGDSRANYSRIHPNVWKYFRTVFPCLRVNLSFVADFSVSEPRNMDTFIVQHMPIRALRFQWTKVSIYESSVEIGTLLRHITSCEINSSLEVLIIVWEHSTTNLAPDLISFTNACPNLRRLDLQIQDNMLSLETVFDSWLENRPVSLNIVTIIITGFHSLEGKMFYSAISNFYAPIFQPLGLSLSLVTI